MDSGKTETRRKLYAILELLSSESSCNIEVRTIEGQSPEMVVGPTEQFNELHKLGDLPGVHRTSVEGGSFGGWKFTYFVTDRGILTALREYKKLDERLKSAAQELKAAKQTNPRLALIGNEMSAVWVIGFNSSDDAREFGARLTGLGFEARAVGSAVTVGGHDLKKQLLEAEAPEQDDVNHPSHYASESGLEAIEVIEAFFHGNAFLANTFKYIARAGKKGGEAKRLEDLRKARWYLEREIKREEAREGS